MRKRSSNASRHRQIPEGLRILTVWSVTCSLVFGFLWSDASAQTNRELEIRIGFYIDPVDKVDRSDLKFTLDDWADDFASDRYPLIKVTLFENEQRFRQSLAAGTIDAGACYGYQFSSMAESVTQPPFLLGRDIEPLVEFLLLIRRDEGIDTARDLKGRKIIVNTGRRGRLPLMWLRRYFLSEGVSEDPEEFSEISHVADSFNAIAPVFFGNASACVITRREFQENAKLNAQVVRDLHVVANSLNMPTRVMLFSPVIDRGKRDLIELRAEKMAPAIYPQTFLDAVNETLIEYQKGDLAEVAKLAGKEDASKAGGDATLTQSVEESARDVGDQKE